MDGWNESVQECLEENFSEMESLMYEVRNCVKGCYTGAHTNEELAEYVTRIAEGLMDSAASLRYCEEDSEEEEE